MRYLQAFVAGCVVILAFGLISKNLQGNSRTDVSTQTASQNERLEATDGQRKALAENAKRRIEERDRLRQAAAAQNATDFSYLRYSIDTSNATPQACFSFSAPLDPEKDYSPYIRFEPALNAAISANGRDLCVGGLSFSDKREATILAGLPSLDGRELDENETVPVEFQDRPAYVGFKGAGIILPRLDADGLPIETVNVDKVSIKVRRVNDRALAFKSATQGITRAEGGYGYLYGNENPNDVSEPVWSGEMDINSVQNAPVVSVFPLAEAIGELKPGAYFVEIEDARETTSRRDRPAGAMRWIVMTDLALTAYDGESGLDVVVRSLQTARQVGSVRLQLVARNNEILTEKVSDGSRAVRFDGALLNGEGNLRPKLVVAFGPSGDFAMLDLTRAPIDLSSENINGRRPSFPVDGYLFTERGIYRPGETIHVTGMFRDEAGRAITDRKGRFVVYRPNGMEAHREPFEKTALGGVSYSYELPDSAARGQWRIAAEIDGTGSVATTRVAVEDFVPQRIAVELDADKETPLLRGEFRDIEVESRFLYGAPGAGLGVRSEARLEVDRNPFEGFKGYVFGKHDSVFREQIIELPDQTTDGAGVTNIRLNPGRRGRTAAQPLRLRTVVSVLEPGGRAVSESTIIPYRPAKRYLGVKPDFETAPGEDEPAKFKVVSLDTSGEAKAASVDWKVVEVYYNYDWYRDGENWRWRRSRYVREVNTGRLNIDDNSVGEISTAGLGSWGDHRVILTDAETGAETSYQFWVGWGGQAGDGVEAPDRVRISTPEKAPDVGERAQISVIAPYDGEAQIVVATDRVLSVSYQSVSEKGTKLSIPVTEEWGEGAYVMVSVHSPRDAITEPKPRRAIGVSYVPVNVSDRVFDVSFKAPELVRPRTTETIEVKVEGGRRERMYLTLAAVDEGILRLTKFATPDPESHFFGKKALGVDLFDDYGRLLDPNLAAPGAIRSGGDALGGEGLSVVPTKTVALFSGIVDIGRDGRAEIPMEFPNFNGELRLMAVAWSANGVGSADQALTIRDPVPVELSLPRFLSPGDKAVATASIDNVELGAGQFSAQLVSAGGVSFAEERFDTDQASGARVDRPVSLEAGEEGISDLTLAVSGPENFSVAHNYQIQTRSAFLPVTRITRELMPVGVSYRVPNAATDGLVPGSEAITVSFSPLPIDAGSLYASLSRYPYGCTEQISSRVLPLLYSEQLVALADQPVDVKKASAQVRVQDAINTLLSRQSPDGAIGLWREGDRSASPWIGAYVTDFLLRAKEEGYNVPSAALDRALNSLSNVAQGEAWRVYGYDTDVWESRWHSDTEAKLMRRSAPFALYVLAKAGKADIARLRYIHDRELSKLDSPLAQAHLGAALAQLGDRSRATSAFNAAFDSLGYKNDGDYYQTPLRDLAGILALAAEAEMTELSEALSGRLGRDIPDADQLTTQEKAFLLLATNAVTGGKNDVQIAANGSVREGGAGRYLMDSRGEAVSADFTNDGAAPVWRTTLVRGAPSEAPSAINSNVKVAKDIFTMDGRRANLASVTRGDRFVVRVGITPEQKRTNPMIVADLLPAGFEIEAILRPDDGASGKGAYSWLGNLHPAKVSEARDDRFIAAVDVRAEARQLAYVVRAVTPGSFTMPGVVVEDMYRPEVFGRTEATILNIAGDAS